MIDDKDLEVGLFERSEGSVRLLRMSKDLELVAAVRDFMAEELLGEINELEERWATPEEEEELSAQRAKKRIRSQGRRPSNLGGPLRLASAPDRHELLRENSPGAKTPTAGGE